MLLVVPSPELLAVASGTVALIISSSNSMWGLLTALCDTNLYFLIRPLQALRARTTEGYMMMPLW